MGKIIPDPMYIIILCILLAYVYYYPMYIIIPDPMYIIPMYILMFQSCKNVFMLLYFVPIFCLKIMFSQVCSLSRITFFIALI